MLRKFSEFLDEGVIIKVRPNKERAQSLIEESERKFKVLKRQIKVLGIDDELANEYVLMCYDCLMFLIRAKMLIDGYYAVGKNAHEAEVSYLQLLNFDETDIRFLDKMRYYRNGMLYYGSRVDSEYAKKVMQFTEKTLPKIKSVL